MYKNINAIDPFCALKKNKPNEKLTIGKEKNGLKKGFMGCI
jgi:hypothetical protein